jgi:hypothetical protein
LIGRIFLGGIFIIADLVDAVGLVFEAKSRPKHGSGEYIGIWSQGIPIEEYISELISTVRVRAVVEKSLRAEKVALAHRVVQRCPKNRALN